MCLSGDNALPEELRTQQHDGKNSLRFGSLKKTPQPYLPGLQWRKSHFSLSMLIMALKWQKIGTKKVWWLYVSVIREHFLIGQEKNLQWHDDSNNNKATKRFSQSLDFQNNSPFHTERWWIDKKTQVRALNHSQGSRKFCIIWARKTTKRSFICNYQC